MINDVKLVGWGRTSWQQHQFASPGVAVGGEVGLKANLLNIIHSIRTVVRIPLILLNIGTIFLKLLLG